MKYNRLVGFAIVAAAAGMLFAMALPVSAAIYYPWCARYSGSDSSGGSNCYFETHQQCMETIRGIGGVCEPNGFYYAARPEERAPIRNAPRRRY